jgi:aminoglycoside phosphotransferase (APT) family kinase protein
MTQERDRIPARFRAEVVRRIGHGGEATVYELAGERVLRVFHGPRHGAGQIAEFYRQIAGGTVSFALPRIIEQGEDRGVHYSVDRLIHGRPLHELMASLIGDERERALAAYMDAAFEIASLPVVRDEYGEFLRDEDSIQRETWGAFLLARMQRCLEASSGWLREDVPALEAVVAALEVRIEALSPERKALVHGDYFPGNVLIGDDLTVSGVIDFGPLTVIGDPWLDLASALMFLEVARPGYTEADTALVRARLVERVDPSIVDVTATYRAWYAMRFSPYRDDDPNLYAWCVTSLREASAAWGT